MLSELYNTPLEAEIGGKKYKITRLDLRDFGELADYMRSQDYAELQKHRKEWELSEEFCEARVASILETKYHLDQYIFLATTGQGFPFALWLSLRKHQPEVTLDDVMALPYAEIFDFFVRVNRLAEFVEEKPSKPKRKRKAGSRSKSA